MHLRARTTTWRTNSEAATMIYVKDNTQVPVPRVYLHDDDASGEVGGPWIVMEYVPHPSLYAQWPTMSLAQRTTACTSIASIWDQLLSLRFQAIGSLRIDISGKIDVGPLVVRNCSSDSLNIQDPDPEKCGPFSTVREWLLATAKGHLDFQYSTSDHQHELVADAIQKVESTTLLDSRPPPPMDRKHISTFVLRHIDLCPRNILVSPGDPTIITAVIDWEGACTAPIWDVSNKNLPPILGGELDHRSPALVRPVENYRRFYKELSDPEMPTADEMATLATLEAVFRATERDIRFERETLEKFLWGEIGRLNEEWAVTAGARDLRNLATIAKGAPVGILNIEL
ncbi:hypothetical protein C8F04DRAFT_1085113, partial [Mycena alexandri]